MGSSSSNDLAHILITYHLPEAVRAEKQDITSAQRHYECIHFDGGTLTQTAINLVAFRMCVDVVSSNNTIFYHTRNYGMIAGDGTQAFRLPVEVGTTIANVGNIGG